MVAEKTIPHLTTQEGNPVELRLILQRKRDGKYRVSHHYMKVGAHPLAANVGRGGHIQETLLTLRDILLLKYPKKKPKTIQKMAKHFVKKAVSHAEAFMNGHLLYWLPTLVVDHEDPELPNEFGVNTPPILSTFDYLVGVKPKGVTPTAMEHHAEGNFDLLDDMRNYLIPREKWREMMELHRFNVRRIYAEIRNQTPMPKSRWNFFSWWAEQNQKRHKG